MGGTMIDTYPAVDATLVEVCRDHGHTVDPHEVSLLTRRRSIAEAGEALAERFGIAPENFTEAYAILKASWRTNPPPVMEGARDLMARVRKLGGLNLVITHRDRTSASTLLEVHALEVDDMLCAPDGHPRKPNPSMHQLVVRRHALDPADCLSVGDRTIDAEAAIAAGLDWALLETPGIPMPITGGLRIHRLSEITPLQGSGIP